MAMSVSPFRIEPDHRDEMFLRGTVHHIMSSLGADNIAELPTLHTAKGLLPPTNRWFSGLAFGESHAVFAMPYSYQQTRTGFTFGLPKVITSRHSVTGPALSDIDVDLGASSFRIARYDQVSITIEFLNEIGRVLGHGVLAQGVPYISYTAVVPHQINISAAFSMAHENLATYCVDGRSYGLVTSGNYSARGTKLNAGDFMSLIALPQTSGPAGGKEQAATFRKLATIASFPVIRTEVTAAVSQASVTTTIRYIAKDNGPVAVVRMPHHGPGGEATLGTYATVSGTVSLHSEKRFSWATKTQEPAQGLDLSGLGDEQRKLLLAQVETDMSAEPREPLDTYYAGKAFARDVNLLDLGAQLGALGTAAFRAGLEQRFLNWMDPDGVDRQADRFFVYEPHWRGVVGVQASFGADQFNDHHTQAGYFLYAGAMLSEGNPSFQAKAQLVLDALAWDVAAPIENAWVPLLRVFDPYRGHSWASGLAASDDGNKQETIAEAINCWNGLALWAKQTGNPGFESIARWMLAQEVEASLTYWTNLNLSDPVIQGYQHTVMPQVWGGKHEYASWFNSEPAAILGSLIQPLTAVSSYLTQDSERISDNLDEAVGFFQDYDVHQGDYLLMYGAMGNLQAAEQNLAKALDFPADLIDDGNSKSYLLAWIMTQKKQSWTVTT